MGSEADAQPTRQTNLTNMRWLLRSWKMNSLRLKGQRTLPVLHWTTLMPDMKRRLRNWRKNGIR